MVSFIGIAFVTGCFTVESNSLGTDEISAEMELEADGEQTHARVVLREGGSTSNNFVRVSEEDQLKVDDGTRALLLREQSLATFYYYTQDFTAQAAGTLFTFSLVRELDGGAPDSTASLPEPFTITGPDPESAWSRTSEAIPLSWDPPAPGDTMRLVLKGACIEPVELDLDTDVGAWFIRQSDLVSLDGTEAESCQLNLTLSRVRPGVMDTRFAKGGFIEASQVRTLELVLDP